MPRLAHTPGPWTVDRIQGRITDEDYPSVVGFHVSASLFRASRETVEADARLIAAAPELLAALRELVESLRFEELRDGEYMDLSAELALITRIEGGQ